MRAGIQAVSRGQTEAASALGLRPNRVMSLVVLPQALRVIIPPLISQYLNLTKNSSLAIAVGYADVRATLGGITMNQTGRELECMLLLMGFYLVLSLLISSVMNWYNASRGAEGAVRWPTSPSPAPRCSRRRRRPRSAVGAIGWARANLFSSWLNAILTILSVARGLVGRSRTSSPGSAHAVWNAGSLAECRQIIAERWGEGASGACFAVIRERWKQFLFGFYPSTSTGARRSPSC